MAWLCVSDVLDKSLAGTGGLNLSGPCFILLSTMCSNLCTQAQCGHWCDYKTIGTGVEYENRLSREKPYMALAISLMWFNLEGGKKKLRGIPELWINMSCGLSAGEEVCGSVFPVVAPRGDVSVRTFQCKITSPHLISHSSVKWRCAAARINTV